MDPESLNVPVSFNTRNIPKAAFFEIPKAVTEAGDVSSLIRNLEEQLSKYNFMFESLSRQLNQLNEGLPELRQHLESIDFAESAKEKMEEGEDVYFRYELAPGVYSKAKITNAERINIWLGSKVMVEYTLEEGRALLQKNIADMEKTIVDLERNLQYLKEQITVTEVAISRTFNWDVQNRRAEKSKGLKDDNNEIIVE